MCRWILLITVFLISGCANKYSEGSLLAQRNSQAAKEYRMCLKYMANRSSQLVYPDPLVYCRAVQTAVRNSQRVEDWRI